MGTRNLTCVYLDGSCKVAQYGQWDGYPGGQGATALAFLLALTPEKRAQFETRLRAIPVLTDEQVKERWQSCGAEILQSILDGEADGVSLAESFAKDSLFCEWAYVIDLDKNTFEVYKGFNKTPTVEGDRFHSATANDSGYYPVQLIRSWPLSALPDEATFVKECDQDDKEEAA